mgnify:FL=1
MYAYLSGKIAWVEEDALVVLRDGLGLRIRVLPQVIADAREGGEVELYLHHLVREDAEQLVGFRSRDQERLFATLLDVSGVGPKVALALLAAHGADRIRRALVDGDEALLATAPGVGRRLAARIVVELGERMARDAGAAHDRSTGGDTSHGEDRDLAAALRSLGFPSREARDLVDTVHADRTLRGASLTERLRAALKERA